jgi:hypothetical protein
MCAVCFRSNCQKKEADWVRCVQVQRDINKRLKSTRRDIAVKLINITLCEKQAGDADSDEDMEVYLYLLNHSNCKSLAPELY